MRETEIYLIDKSGMVRTIRRKFKPASRPKGGAEAVFIPINKKVGLKGFAIRKEARSAMNRQKRAAKYGVGPKVLSDETFEVIMPVGGTYLSSANGWLSLRRAPNYKKKHRRLYAYKTEVVPKLFNTNAYFAYGKYEAKYEKLITIMEERGLSLSDVHAKNIGMIKGRMVALDFGDLSS